MTSTSLRIAGDELDECISAHIRKDYNLAIGERTAEEIKLTIGSVYPKDVIEEMDIRGRDLISGLPKTATITSDEILKAISDPIHEIVDTIRQTLESTPPELAADVMDTGITLTGGGALLEGLDRLIAEETGMPVTVAKDPLNCVVNGTGIVLENIDRLKTVLISPRKPKF